MSLLDKLRQNQVFCRMFKQKKAYLDNLNTFQVMAQEKSVAEYTAALDYAATNLANAKAKLDKMVSDRDSLRVWVPANQDAYDAIEICATEKISKLADKIEKALKEYNGSGEGQVVL